MRFGPAGRKVVLTAHVISSLGWLGALCAFLVLAIIGLTSDEPALVRGVYLVSEPVTYYAIVPLAIVSLGSGILQSLVTTWGLIQHYWVLFKLVITIFAAFVLLLYTKTVDHFAGLAANEATDLAALRTGSYVLHSGIALILLVLATILAVHKPRGRTRYGWRKQQQLRSASST